ncbi:hypothetical protein OG949_40525 (plasmid) [Streptomyces scopuliridis]|uniref:hypothetical protein n=1 Tax=Streptomyces scopuliridis TaxID=452529 RepID=UPI002DDC84C1|nr:hypothetical protein [Streptomyces scopuliridis]WSB39044.1 hypothetical protein OG949_40525 [Streptomyces scopuliridis]
MPKTSSKTYDYPQDLRGAETDLQRTRAEYQALCAELPWSVDPAPGWESDKQIQSDYKVSMPDSPGYTDKQKQHEDELRDRLVELSTAVTVHPYWATLAAEDVVDARMTLKKSVREALA